MTDFYKSRCPNCDKWIFIDRGLVGKKKQKQAEVSVWCPWCKQLVKTTIPLD